MSITTTNFLNDIDYDKNNQVLIFKHENNFFKVLPEDPIDLIEYANKNLLSDIKYKIFNSYNDIINLSLQDLILLFENSDSVVK